uniref:Uncharacterized protein n=1 Tax=Anopheles farauti TaxID=69004 RepID=A0A182QU74_9DIPT
MACSESSSELMQPSSQKHVDFFPIQNRNRRTLEMARTETIADPGSAVPTRVAGVTAFNLDDTNSNYSGTPSIRKKSFQIYSGAECPIFDAISSVTRRGRPSSTEMKTLNTSELSNASSKRQKGIRGNPLAPDVVEVGPLENIKCFETEHGPLGALVRSLEREKIVVPAQEELEPLNNLNINNAAEGVFDTSRCWNTVKCLFNGVICSHKFKNVQLLQTM